MKKKLLTMVVVGALITSCISSSVLAATTTTTSSQNNVSITNTKEATLKELSQSEIKRLDKYIELTNDGQFVFNESKVANKNDKEILKQYLNLANAQIQKAKESNHHVVVNTTKKTVKVTTNTIQLNSIDSDAYADYSIMWNGVRLYLSHGCISDMKNYVNTAIAAGTTEGAAAAYFIGGLAGMSGGAAAILGGLSTTSAIYMYEHIISNDEGDGVFIDFPWTLINNPAFSIFLIKVQPYYEEA